MHVGSVSPRSLHTAPGAYSARRHHNEPPARAVDSKKANHAAGQPHVDGPAEEGRAHGVLRLLEAGHFKGVADVRLRINFHAEITQRQTAGVKETAHKGVAALVGAMASEVNTLVEAGSLDEDQAAALGGLMASFEAAAQDAETSFQASDQPDLDALTGVLQAAFDTLLASLQTLLGPPAAEPVEASPEGAVEDVVATGTPIDEAPAVVAEEETASPLDFLSRLAETFRDALEGLTASVNTTDVLPPLSEPNGQGKAYAKFVAQYEQLRASAGVYGSAQVDLSV